MKKLNLIIVMFLCALIGLEGQDNASYYDVEYTRLSKKNDTLSQDKYTIKLLNKENYTNEWKFRFEINSHDSTTIRSNRIINDLLHQEIDCSLNIDDNFISLLNFEELELDYTYPHMIDEDCGSNSIEEKIVHYLNNNMPFLKILVNPDVLKSKIYSDYSPNGYELIFKSNGEAWDSTFTFLLDNAMKDELCYNKIDCIKDWWQSDLDYQREQAIEEYEDLSAKVQRRVDKVNYVQAKERYAIDKLENRFKKYEKALINCLDNKETISQTIYFTQNRDAGIELSMQRDNLRFNGHYSHLVTLVKEKGIWFIKEQK